MNTVVGVSDNYVIPEPEPKEIDEKTSMELRHLCQWWDAIPMSANE